MKMHKGKLRGFSGGLLLALIAASPAVADDTELLLTTPSSLLTNKPNILFIIDTSTSMTSTEETTEPYDSSFPYNGDCDNDRVYWSVIETVPTCNSANTSFVPQDKFVCDVANQQMLGIGSYSSVMVQYRPGLTGGAAKWQYLAPGFNDHFVECETDSGTHGDGTAGFVYAAKGAGLSYPFTDIPNQELSWGSAPRNQNYTFYDGNYLNWKNDPVTVNLDRMTIVKSVIESVLRSVSGVNVGMMRFNESDGGTVIKAIGDLESDLDSHLATVDSLAAVDHTTLAETLYESALYWRGTDAYFGENDHLYATDPPALDGEGPENYAKPPINACTKNFNVLLSDGRAGSRDDESYGLVPTLPNFTTALAGRTACDGEDDDDGRCMDDVSEYLSKEDIDPLTPGDQFVTTHTIGFAVDTANLRSTAERSGGSYFLADDVESLTNALLDIVADITARNISFAAPAVSVNAFNRTQHLNDLYLTVFSPRARIHWPGNLKKFRLDDGVIVDAVGLGAINPVSGFLDKDAVSFWGSSAADGGVVTDGGAANELPVPTSRNLYTNNGTSADLTNFSNAITTGNSSAFSLADFGLTGGAGEPSIDDMIRWLRDDDVYDFDKDPDTTQRKQMGDPLHSQPAAIVYGGTEASPDVVVYSATNDGYLHAIDADTGEELWSFIPKQLLDNMSSFYFDARSKYKQYGLDGNITPVVADRNNNGIVDGTDFVYILFGMRRGGNTLFALDVTNKNAPKLLWDVSHPQFGQTWSTPIVTRIDVDDTALNADKAVVVVGGGYDSIHDSREHPLSPDVEGAGIYMFDLVSGAELWRAGSDTGADLELPGTMRPGLTRSIASKIRVIDMSGDGVADRMYAADMGGQILRFDIFNGQKPADLVAGGVIAQLGAEALATPTDADTRRFYNAPDVSLFTDKIQNRRYLALSIGSGYRAHPLDNGASDRFYSVRDPHVFNQLTQLQYNSLSVITDSDLIEVSGSVRTVISPTKGGWKLTLPPTQKVLSDSATFADSVFFVSFSPEANLTNVCEPSVGRNFLYRVNVANGDPVVSNLGTLAAIDADAARFSVLSQGGIGTTPMFLFPTPSAALLSTCNGNDCSPPPIACVGVECFDPGFANFPVRTLWTQDGVQ